MGKRGVVRGLALPRSWQRELALSCAPSASAAKPKLLDQVRQAIRARHDSLRTERAYVAWIKRFIFFHRVRHPTEMGEQEIRQFSSDLAANKKVSASTQNQAFKPSLFLDQRVLDQPIGWVGDVVRAKGPKRLPVVLTRQEVKAILAQLEGVPLLVCTLLYGALDCDCRRHCEHESKDVGFVRNEIVVRDGRGEKDRVRMLPAAVKEPLLQHLEQVRRLHQAERHSPQTTLQ